MGYLYLFTSATTLRVVDYVSTVVFFFRHTNCLKLLYARRRRLVLKRVTVCGYNGTNPDSDRAERFVALGYAMKCNVKILNYGCAVLSTSRHTTLTQHPFDFRVNACRRPAIDYLYQPWC